MKTQIKRFSPHQNAKVFAVLTAVSSLIFLIPMILIMTFTMPPVDAQGNPVELPIFMFVMAPIFYLIFGYISVAIGCLIYNFLAGFIGGIEFELSSEDDSEQSA